jgi:glycosyltransferase involved in cell wall biosynthesis
MVSQTIPLKSIFHHVKLVRNNHNRGKGAAIKRGLLVCLKPNPDVIITVDADGQHDPLGIIILLKPIQHKLADLVIGSRYNTLSKQEVLRLPGIGLLIIYIRHGKLMKINVRVRRADLGNMVGL